MLRQGRIREALHEKVWDLPAKERLARIIGGRDGDKTVNHLIAGLSLGELLYDYVRLDPRVLAGVDFARAEDLSNIFYFSLYARELLRLDAEALTGNLNNLQGYVAEQVVAWQLEARGHEVTFPPAPNNEGWDILVDGQPFQVKCMADSRGVLEHLERYPDIPVLVNKELAGEVAGLDSVYVMDYLSREEIVKVTETTIQAAADLHDFEIPWLSLAVSSARNIKGILNNEATLGQAIVNVGSDVAARTITSTLGQALLSAAGGLLFGPAGVLVGGGAGAILGAYQGGYVAKKFRSLFTKAAEDAASKELTGLMMATAKWIDLKQQARAEKVEMIKDALKPERPANREVMAYLEERAEEDRRYFEAKKKQLKSAATNPETLGEDIVSRLHHGLTLVVRSAVHPARIQKELKQFFTKLNQLYMERKGYRL